MGGTTMNILRSVHVEGFWGTKDFTVEFHPDINFLIGVNGSGKTTLINMVAAALTADLQTLDRLPFKKLVINLVDLKSKRKPSIEIEKRPRKELPFPQVSFRIRDQASDPGKTYSLDDFRRDVVFRGEYQSREIRRRASTIIEHLRKLANVSWLSIHRSQALRTQDDRSFESTVDKKLDQMANDLVKYFSLLIRRSEAEVAKFQEAVFLSLIDPQATTNLFTSLKQLNLQDEKDALVQIFQQFGMKPEQFADQVTQHFSLVESALDVMAQKRGYDTRQFAALLAMARIHSLVQEWRRLGERQDIINAPREEFLRILNDMITRKSYHVNEKNELISVVSDSKAKLPLNELSSGEKQLLIILGEGLLQEKAPWIYIADEPELSLHVNWQEQLISNLRVMNPHAQILFATHSPDIVSSYGSHVFDMQKILT
jgi:predicted ATPase